jgi:hypothetical protein
MSFNPVPAFFVQAWRRLDSCRADLQRAWTDLAMTDASRVLHAGYAISDSVYLETCSVPVCSQAPSTFFAARESRYRCALYPPEQRQCSSTPDAQYACHHGERDVGL